MFKLKFVTIIREFVKKKGRNNVSVDDLIHLITSKGRGMDVILMDIYHIL